MIKKEALIIPSYEPTDKLIRLVEDLKKNFVHIIVIDDGSGDKYKNIYISLEKMECIILKHTINMGKGRALKTAFNYYLTELEKECLGVITLDSDGQHLPEDVDKIAKKLKENPDKLVMGTRNFKLDLVPLKSRIGNLLTVKIMKFLCNIKTKDTQTGLRALGNKNIQKILGIEGERFEYETNVLLELNNLDIETIDEEIETIYYEENKGTHFNPIKDSLKIYKIILKFIFSGATSAVFDIFIFWFLQKMDMGIFVSNLCARFISSVLNFTLNKKLVFNSNKNLKSQLFSYYSLVLIMGLFSSTLIKYISYIGEIKNLVLIKLFVEVFLFFISFSIQNKFIFKKRSL